MTRPHFLRVPVKAAAFAAAALVALANCGQEPAVIPSRTLERPTDLSFVCMHASSVGGRPVVTATTMGVCTDPLPAGESRDATSEARTMGLMGVIANSARGELGAVDFDRNRMVDLDPAVPGYNMLPVGQLPEALSVSPDGCKTVTANRGSCDVSLVDNSRLFAGVFNNANAVTGPGSVSTRLAVLTDGGPLRSRPGEIAFLPGPTSAAATKSCQLTGSVGADGAVKPWRAVITFPSCGLVGLVEFPSGRLINSAYVKASGLEPAGTNPQCPVDCGAIDVAANPVVPDAGLPQEDAGAVAMGRLAVEALTFLPYVADATPEGGQTLYLGARDADTVLPVRATNDGRLVQARAPLRLAEQPAGVFRLRASVQPFAPTDRAFVGGGQGKFLYAVVGDGSVRVINLAPAEVGGLEVECDANIDTKALATGGLDPRCVPVGSGLPRTLRARGPGIQVPPLAAGPDLLPPHAVDVTFFEAKPAANADSTGSAYKGAYAYVLLSNSDILVVNVFTQQEVELTPGASALPFSHSLRNALSFVELDKGGKRPRVTNPPTASVGNSDLPFALRPNLSRDLIPRVEGYSTLPEGAREPDKYCSPELPGVVYACFDRPEEAVPQTWAVVWEGTLPGAGRATGRLANRSMPNTVGVWEDVGAAFCASGVQAGDVIRLDGCGVDADCGDPDDFRCVPSVAGVSGLCTRKTDEAAFRQSVACQRLLKSRRRYEVAYAGPKELGLALKLQELPRPSVSTCTKNEDCAAGNTRFECLEPVAGQGARCVVPCMVDANCDAGFVCESAGDPARGLCVEAPLPDPLCMAETTAYEVQAGKSFLVRGTFTPSFATTVDVNGLCQPLASRNPRFANRIPLSAPHCANVPDPAPGVKLTSQLLRQSPAAEGVAGNPCLFVAPNFDETALTDPAIKGQLHVHALFENPEVRFVVTNLEQNFGDGATLQFTVRGGFRPDQIVTNIQPQIAVPAMFLTGPTFVPANKDDDKASPAVFPYVYMVDAGLLGSSQRGQILRIDTRRAAYDVSVSARPFQIR